MQLTESETPMWDLDFATRLDLFRQYKIFSVKKMARNKRKKNMKDKSKFKALRIEAKKQWRNKRAKAKRLKQAVEHAVVSPQAKKKSYRCWWKRGTKSCSCSRSTGRTIDKPSPRATGPCLGMDRWCCCPWKIRQRESGRRAGQTN